MVVVSAVDGTVAGGVAVGDAAVELVNVGGVPGVIVNDQPFPVITRPDTSPVAGAGSEPAEQR